VEEAKKLAENKKKDIEIQISSKIDGVKRILPVVPSTTQQPPSKATTATATATATRTATTPLSASSKSTVSVAVTNKAPSAPTPTPAAVALNKVTTEAKKTAPVSSVSPSNRGKQTQTKNAYNKFKS
jgi:hypothetical protein